MSPVVILIIIVILAIAFAIAFYVIAGRVGYEDEYEYHSIEKFFHTEDEDTHDQ